MTDDPSSTGDTRITTLRVIDLRSELEAQLRAVLRLEELLRERSAKKNLGGLALRKAIGREVTDMLENNASIRTILTDLANEAESPAKL